ncbi:MAG: sugar isomerase, partial [Thermoanaerobaculales bacterium]
LRVLAKLEASSPTENIVELSARANDYGWQNAYATWLADRSLSAQDCILVLSVGGGSVKDGVSLVLVRALECAQEVGARILGIVGRDGGYTAQVADTCVLIPAHHPERVTPNTEGVAALVLHVIVTHPALATRLPKWESVDKEHVEDRG